MTQFADPSSDTVIAKHSKVMYRDWVLCDVYLHGCQYVPGNHRRVLTSRVKKCNGTMSAAEGGG